MMDGADDNRLPHDDVELDDDAALSAAAKIIERKDDTIRSLCRELNIAEARIRILELRQQAALRNVFDLSDDAVSMFHRRQAD
jgi:hypothetical protein